MIRFMIPSNGVKPDAGKLLALTGIRGIAACWVVGFHLSTNLQQALGGLPARGTIILRSGYLAVDLFFMLSGFILAYRYGPRLAVDRTEALRDFCVGRVFRILPLNWAMLIILLILSTAMPSPVWSSEPLTMASFWASMALVQAWGFSNATAWNFPAWSLSTEWAAYALFPAMLLVGEKVRGARSAFAAGAGALLALSALMIAVGDSTLDHSWLLGLPRCFLQFFAGVCFWRAFDRGLFDRRHADTLVLAGLVGLLVVIVLPAADLLAPFAFGALILSCALGSSIAAALFANRTAMFLGEISFSIYLSHAIIISCGVLLAFSLGLANASEAVRLVFLSGICAAILGVSFLSWKMIERPSQVAGRRFQNHLDRQSAGVSKI